MKTLQDKKLMVTQFIKIINPDNEHIGMYYSEDVKEKLTDFYNDYWQKSYEGDKCKKHITCDELDYLMDKHFGSLVKIETIQDLENQEK